MKIKKIISKIFDRYKKFKNYPLTKDKPLFALFKYIKFNCISYFNDKERVYNWVNGLKFYAKKGEAGIVPNIYFNLFDYEDSMFLLNHIHEGDLFIDVGANVGHFSMLAAIKKAKVIAIEPIPDTCKRLTNNIKLNHFENLVTIKNIGIGNKIEKLYFTNNFDVMNNVSVNQTKNTIEVEVTTLDILLYDLKPKCIKIDVEGYEYFVLQGATSILKSPSLKYLIIELNDSSERYDVKSQQIHDFILSYDFVPAKYDVTMDKFKEQSSFNKDSFNTLYMKKKSVVC